ncbi:hypothetical protein E3N88_23046 [Mikania micrantha]|uniref:PB1-like domain-containing protein n=1 Tax=Mikania micrantha TaxID=192012 RepID=A0A5N6NEU5_9ASTR|nr:hypothetical protein E3N88_23046 [Mikania micrantha]
MKYNIEQDANPEAMLDSLLIHTKLFTFLLITYCKSLTRLEKLERLYLGGNNFNKSIISCLSFLPSLNTLDLSDSFEFGTSTFPMQDCKSLTRLEKLESLSFRDNYFDKSFISCLSFLPSLNTLDLSGYVEIETTSFPMQGILLLNVILKTVGVVICNGFKLIGVGTMSKLVHLNLDFNFFFSVDDVMRSIAAAFPSLRFLSLYGCSMEGRLFANEVPNLPYLKVLILSLNELNGTLPIQALASFHHLEILDLSYNNFIGSITSIINSLTSGKVVSFAGNALNGSLMNDEFCKLKNLHELDLSHNMLDGMLPECLNRLSFLKFFDISSNQLTGVLLPYMITNLTSLEYVDFSHNKFEGSFSLSWFSNHTKLEYVAFSSDNDKFEVETEEPAGWTCMSQLKVLILSRCNLKSHKGSVIPSFLLHQHKLRELDMSHNSLKGQFPDWLIKNNTLLRFLNLRDNSFGGIVSTSFHRNPHKLQWLDVSGNHMIGHISNDIHESLPYLLHLNLSRNSIDGVIPSSIGDLSVLEEIDLSQNMLSGEVPIGLLTNHSNLRILVLSNNNLHGEVLSRNFNVSYLSSLQLDNNHFTGKMENMSAFYNLEVLDISNNLFTDLIPNDVNNDNTLPTLLKFLDLSQNNFSGHIPFFLNFQNAWHIHLGFNKFTGSIPESFSNLTKVSTLDIGNNYLSGRIPNFLGELSNLRVLLLGKNNFNGSIPRKLCNLTNANMIDLSSNLLSSLIPRCLQNIARPSDPYFMQNDVLYRGFLTSTPYLYSGTLYKGYDFQLYDRFRKQNEILFTTKTLSMAFKGDVLNIMSALDLSCNKLTGNIPEELGLLAQIRALNLSHNRLTGPIPVKFSNLANIESLDLSFNGLTGKVPSELIKLNSLEVFNVSFNNLSGSLPEIKAQFGTFTKESYKGNPLLCGLPLEKECTMESHRTQPSNEEGSDEKWNDIDMVSFYGSCSTTWFVFMLGFAFVLYVNHYWRRLWFHLVDERMEDDVLVKVWYGGKLSKNPKLHYVGGETSMIKVEVDKMSYFELVDYVMEVGLYEKKDFFMFYLLPGKKFEEGLVELKNDEDVSRMMVDLGEDVRHILHLYVESKTNKEELAQPSKITTQKEVQLIQSQTSTSSPLKLTKSAARRLPCNTSISEQGSEDGSEEGSEDGSEEGSEEGSEDEYGSDTDDEEWRASIGAIKKSNKEDESSKKKLLEQFLAEPDSTHEESLQITHHSDASSYEDSDGDVNSPGNSEDDDIKGRKYKSNVPVVTKSTDWSKWKWVVGTRFPTRDAFRDAVKNYTVYSGRDVVVSLSNKNRLGRLGVKCESGCPFKVYLS